MYFDEMATLWDTPERVGRARSLAASIWESLDLGTGAVALEFGCGTGLISMELHDRFERILCVDSSPVMLKVLEEKIRSKAIDSLSVHDTDILETDQYLGKLDVVYSSMVFHHIVDWSKELRRLKPLLKKDGILVIVDLDTVDPKFHESEAGYSGHHGFDRLNFQKTVEGCGFHSISFQDVYQGEKLTSLCTVPYSLFLCIAKNTP